jgi:hypothetical protein
MRKKNLRIWIWLQETVLHKAVYNPTTRTLSVYNQEDSIVLRRTGISAKQLASLEVVFSHLGAKRLDRDRTPFVYL